MDHPSEEQLGQADWLWDSELRCHIPCCNLCMNGPLEGDQIQTGVCTDHD